MNDGVTEKVNTDQLMDSGLSNKFEELVNPLFLIKNKLWTRMKTSVSK